MEIRRRDQGDSGDDAADEQRRAEQADLFAREPPTGVAAEDVVALVVDVVADTAW
ncbi:hypothetical protein [Micromonospora haikouensis]|uniref:hypothetical protein n=1 Tax=Micromonospora haikouensis TaxID=686309 RepID=UPI003D705D53